MIIVGAIFGISIIALLLTVMCILVVLHKSSRLASTITFLLIEQLYYFCRQYNVQAREFEVSV